MHKIEMKNLIKYVILFIFFSSNPSWAGKARIIESADLFWGCKSHSCEIDEASVPKLIREIKDEKLTFLRCTRKGYYTRSFIVEDKKIYYLDRLEYFITITPVSSNWKIDNIVIKIDNDTKIKLNRESLKILGSNHQCEKVTIEQLVNPYLNKIKKFKRKNKI